MNSSFQVNGLSVLLFRVSLSGIFITAGISHLLYPEKISQRIASANMGSFARSFGDPQLLSTLSGYLLLLGGIAFMAGILSRYAAAILFLVLIPITIMMQTGNGLFHGPLWKNIALFGGLLFFIINNPKVYSIYNR